MHTAAYTLYHRSAWHAVPPRPTSSQQFTTEGFVHHSEDSNGQAYDTLAKQEAHIRDIQRFHMDRSDPKHGWSDIGYHYVIFQPNHRHVRAHIFGARAVTAVPAAQLDHNSNTLAICVIGNGDRETLHQNTKLAIVSLLNGHRVRKVGGHRDVTPTDCPGERFYRDIPSIAKLAGIPHF